MFSEFDTIACHFNMKMCGKHGNHQITIANSLFPLDLIKNIQLDPFGMAMVFCVFFCDILRNGDRIDHALRVAGVAHGSAAANGLQQQVTVVPVRLVKGLEVDAAIVVEPVRIVDVEPQGMRSLYVAFTRATKRLRVVHTGELPDVLTG